MSISFLTKENIQIVVISAFISPVEAAAIRNKLEEKIKKGRKKIIFDLLGFPLNDNTAHSILINLVKFTINRGIKTACCGIQTADWPRLLVEGPIQTKTFLSRVEAEDYLKSVGSEELPSKLQDAGKPKSEKDLQEEIKNRDLQKLLTQYSIYQQTDHDDPFRLEFFSIQCKSGKSEKEALDAEKKALDSESTIALEIEILQNECIQLSELTKQATIDRKNPSSEDELTLKENTLSARRDELLTMISSSQSALSKVKLLIENLAKVESLLKEKCNFELAGLELEIKKQTADYEEKSHRLKKKDEKEELAMQESKKTP
jgi:anti-anti-sigma regulatory factor